MINRLLPLLGGVLSLAAAVPAHAQSHSSANYSPIVELRQYRLHPGKRDVLIELFDREFVETQEEVGMQVLGQFRVLNDPDRFTWLRGFRSMDERLAGLNAFYYGPVWQEFRDQANATLLDNDDVLLLREARTGSGFASRNPSERPSKDSVALSPGVVIGTIYYLKGPPEKGFAGYFLDQVIPELAKAGITVDATYITERSENNFPRLPVRENENVLVWFATYPDLDSYEQRTKGFESSSATAASLRKHLAKDAEVLRLAATARSLIHH